LNKHLSENLPISVIPAWPESFFTILNQSEGFPTSGNDNENKYSIFRRPAVSAAGYSLL
jgi:hypothetical protein